MIFYPTNEYILVEIVPEYESKDKLYLPEDTRKRTLKAKIIRVGNREKAEELDLEEGDRVLIHRHSGIEVITRAYESDAEDYSYLLVTPEDILGFFM